MGGRVEVAMARSFGLLAVLALPALAVVGCQGSGMHTMPAPPVPSRLEGPSPFELPVFRWSPERETVHRQVCVSEEGTEETVTRAVGLKRHENGLTEVRMEMNGDDMGRAFYTDTGRLAHMTVSEGGKKEIGDVDWGGMGAFNVVHQSLAQRRPVAFKIPLGKMLKSIEGLPPEVKAWNFIGSVEYLGQTTFNNVRSAVYQLSMDMGALRLPGPITLRDAGTEVVASNLTFRGSGEGLAYHDASVGIDLYTHMTMRFRIEATLRGGGGRSQRLVITCQRTLDRTSSKGL